MPRPLTALLVPIALLLPALASAADIDADPASYEGVLGTLKPGDTLHLAAGTYTGGLPITGLHGTADAWITVNGPSSGAPAIFEGDGCCNTVELVDATYIAIEHLKIDGKGIDGVFGVSAKGSAGNVVHHVRVEGCTFVGQNGSQQTVAISTKTPTSGWIIRGNVIDGAGTGLYLGNSNHDEPFVGGVIEHNLIKRTIGYGMQIKDQNPWPDHPAMPAGDARTIIRHNVFLKDDTPSPDGVRPNLFVGSPPQTGPGAGSVVEVYGNVLVHNANESLLQATGRVSIHDNLFVDAADVALRLGQHDGFPLQVARVYDNTFYMAKRGVLFADAATEEDHVLGNLIFAASGIEGSVIDMSDNLIADVASAGMYVASPSPKLGEMDFYPLQGKVETQPLDPSALAGDTDYACDFNGAPRKDFAFRGAYAGAGTNPGWKPVEDIKPAVQCGSGSGGGSGGGDGSGGGGGTDGADTVDTGGCGCRVAADGAPAAAMGAWLIAIGAILRCMRRGGRA